MPDVPSLLELSAVKAGYGRAEVLHGIDLTLAEGELITVIGANGAGKSTLLKTIVGLVDMRAGTMSYRGSRVTSPRPERLVRDGLALVPEGRMLFGPMSVRENLVLGNYAMRRAGRTKLEEALARVHGLFPVLEERASQPAETLSGGEQQMLAIGRALMLNPRLLILDEATEGLAPLIRQEIWRRLEQLKQSGLTILLIDKNIDEFSHLADRHYIVEKGQVVWQGSTAELTGAADLKARYLGI